MGVWRARAIGTRVSGRFAGLNLTTKLRLNYSRLDVSRTAPPPLQLSHDSQPFGTIKKTGSTRTLPEAA